MCPELFFLDSFGELGVFISLLLTVFFGFYEIHSSPIYSSFIYFAFIHFSFIYYSFMHSFFHSSFFIYSSPIQFLSPLIIPGY